VSFISRKRFTGGKGPGRGGPLPAAVALSVVAVAAIAVFLFLRGPAAEGSAGSPDSFRPGRDGHRVDRRELVRMWEEGAFDGVFSETGNALEARPTDYFLLTMRGFSAYQLGVSQIDGMAAMEYFDDSIRVLRRAMLLREGESDGRLFYVLGKAYSQMGDGFADMTIEYLEKARALGYAASDIPEFLGLAYYAVGDYLSSVVAFTRALETTRPSARLLFSIAASYAALDDFDSARAYLVRCIDVSVDSRVTVEARLFLADVLRRIGDADGAERELFDVLDETGENAEARFRLGELYAEKGDGVRARAEWRRARDVDPTHLRAIARLSL